MVRTAKKAAVLDASDWVVRTAGNAEKHCFVADLAGRNGDVDCTQKEICDIIQKQQDVFMRFC